MGLGFLGFEASVEEFCIYPFRIQADTLNFIRLRRGLRRRISVIKI